MKSRHNIRQDRSIVNVTDGTSDALLCAYTLAQPVCTAADSPTANSGRGNDERPQKHQGGWRSMAVGLPTDGA